ncbi:MAG: GTP-binding protein [Candidatus Omnitrophota bacterium]|jgi:Ni2+-binding GTPase involved in maturation of urease and hydrogenase
MKVVICAGPPTTGKTTVLKQVVKRLIRLGLAPAYLKIDVQYAVEDEVFAKEFAIPAKKVYSGELCPDHCNVMVMRDAIEWAASLGKDILFVETAGLCLRCSPYIEGAFGIIVLEATSGMNLPRKIGPMLTLADLAVVTKIDLISQAEREVFRARIISAACNMPICETNALYGIGIDAVAKRIIACEEISDTLVLRGNPPVGTCTVCVGKKEIGWQQHFGVVRPLENEIFYRGE